MYLVHRSRTLPRSDIEHRKVNVDRLDTQVTSLHYHVATLSQEVIYQIIYILLGHMIFNIINVLLSFNVFYFELSMHNTFKSHTVYIVHLVHLTFKLMMIKKL